MIVVLFVLALFMIVSGLACVAQGWPIVRVEQGWALVIAGSVGATGGALLLGVTAAVWRLRRIERALVAARETEPRPFPASAPREVALAPAPLPDAVAPRLEPTVAAPPAVPAVEAVTAVDRLAPDERAVLAAGDIVPGPRFDDHPAPAAATVHEPAPGRSEPDLAPIERDDPLFADTAPAEAEAPGRKGEHEGAEAGTAGVHETPAADVADLLPATPMEGTIVVADAHGKEGDAAEPPERVVAGTYASGGNTYVMYSDGSIEAETPGGRYTFKSLEELKAFASGEGEGVMGRTPL